MGYGKYGKDGEENLKEKKSGRKIEDALFGPLPLICKLDGKNEINQGFLKNS